MSTGETGNTASTLKSLTITLVTPELISISEYPAMSLHPTQRLPTVPIHADWYLRTSGPRPGPCTRQIRVTLNQ
jgi:hypothetical protein